MSQNADTVAIMGKLTWIDASTTRCKAIYFWKVCITIITISDLEKKVMTGFGENGEVLFEFEISNYELSTEEDETIIRYVK